VFYRTFYSIFTVLLFLQLLYILHSEKAHTVLTATVNHMAVQHYQCVFNVTVVVSIQHAFVKAPHLCDHVRSHSSIRKVMVVLSN